MPFGKIARSYPAPPRPGPSRPIAAEVSIDRFAEHISQGISSGAYQLEPWLDRNSEETPAMIGAYTRMAAHPVIKAALWGKIHSVSSLDLVMQPVSDSFRDGQVAEFCSYAYNHEIEGYVPGIIETILFAGLVCGTSICEPVWQEEVKDRGEWRGKRFYREVKDKEHVRLQVDEFRNPVKVVSTFGTAQEWEPEDFIIFRAAQLFKGKGISDFRAAYPAWWRLTNLEKLRMIYLEKFASGGMMVGTYTHDEDRQKLINAITAATARSWAVVPDSVKMELLRLSTGSESELKSAADDYRKDMVTSVAGAVLQMMTAQGAGDMRGDSSTQRGQTELFVWRLALKGSELINRRMTPRLVEENFIDADSPTCSLAGVNYGEMNSLADLYGKAVQVNARPSRKAYALATGVQLATDKDDELTATPAQPAAGGGMPGAPFFGQADSEMWRAFAEFCGGKGGTKGPCPTGGTDDVAVDDGEGLDVLADLGFDDRDIRDIQRRTNKGTKTIERLSGEPKEVKEVDLSTIKGVDSELEGEAEPINDPGDVAPIIIGYDGDLIDGHHRVAGLRAGGAESVQVIIASREDLKAAEEFGGLQGRGSKSEEDWVQWMVARSMEGARAFSETGANAAKRLIAEIKARRLRRRKTATFAEEPDSGKDVALGGPDGKKVEQLLSASIEQGTKTLAGLTRAAVTRLLERGPGAVRKAKRLFSDEEQQQLADQLAAVNATAELLGRARIAERADEAERRARKRADFAEFCGGKGGKPGPCPTGRKSAAPSTLAPGADAKKTSDIASKVFGDKGISAVSAAVGAPDDATVTVRARTGAYAPNNLEVEISHPSFESPAVREIGIDDKDQKFISNKSIAIKADQQGKGIGTDIFATQVEQAQAEGFSYIKCNAARSGETPGKESNGYYTWPRLGYDQPIAKLDGSVMKKAQAAFPQAKTVQDIMSTKEGRDWWKVNGGDMSQAKFDLTPGSRSMKVLQLYREERASRGAKASEAYKAFSASTIGDVEEIDINAEEEAALERAWERLEQSDFAEFCGGKGGTKGPCPKGGGKVAGIKAAKSTAAKPTVAGIASKVEGLGSKKLPVADMNDLAGEMAKMRPSELQQLSAKVASKPGGKAKVAKAKKAATAAVAKAKASPEPVAADVAKPTGPEAPKPAAAAPEPPAPPSAPGKPLAFDPAKETAVAAQSKDVLSKLNSSQKSAISDYTLGGSDDLNAELRAGKVPTDRDSQNMVQSMDAMFDAAPELPEPVNTYRGLAFKDQAKAQEFSAQMDAQIASGSTIEFPSYSSTSLDPEVANKFLGGHGKGGGEGVMMEIKSKHGVYLEGQNEMHAGEKEFLLKRGAKFKATGKRQAQVGGKTVTVYEMEQL